jgi:NAD(P)-dependent dehydrogenase (short-subunit alcohol dehydrogenase family)
MAPKKEKMISFNLENKVALITGASRGIGEAVALALAQHGAQCLLVSRKAEGLAAVAARIAADGGSADAIACHMGDLSGIEQLVQQVRDKYGGLDILVNNAATNPFFGPMNGAPEWAWDKTFDVNLKGPFFLIQQAAELMSAGGGSIVNVASINGVSPAPHQGIYSITKAGMIAMTKAYAKELAEKKIRVNALLPGLTATKFSKALMENDSIYQRSLSRIPMGRHAMPEEMAGAVLYLVSDAAGFTTGTTIVCDGGALA